MSSQNTNDTAKDQSYSPEELKLLAIHYVSKNLTLNDLIQHLNNIEGKSLEFVQNVFEEELLTFVKAEIKNEMAKLGSKGNNEFINEGRKGLTLAFFQSYTKKLTNSNIQLTDERVTVWIDKFRRFFSLLESRFFPIEGENTLKKLIVEWLEVGEMSLETWKIWNKWFMDGISLCTLKEIKWPPPIKNDITQLKFLKALKLVSTPDFTEKEELRKALKLFFENPKIEMEEIDSDGKKILKEKKVVNVIGTNIFLSVIKQEIEKFLKEKNVEAVDIIANNTFHIDENLVGDLWSGKNITVVADKVNVWSNHVIDLSGKGYKSKEKTIAKNGQDGTGENGCDGKDGKAGESSGNITMLTEEMKNPEKLTIKLKGGDGADGEDGGKGGDGKLGKGITIREFNEIVKPFENISLYTEGFYFFEDYCPSGWKKKSGVGGYNRLSHYIYHEFEDSDGRILYYTYGADKGVFYSWFEIVIWVQGTDGCSGGVGGKNGKGGEGGNGGECNIVNSSTGREYSVIKFLDKGNDGVDGKVGANGGSGINGNHIAMIDRSATGENKHYYGHESLKRLKLQYYTKNFSKRRINRYRYIVENKADSYGEFEYADLSTGNLQTQTQEEKKERSTEAQTTMKKSIGLNKTKEKAQKHRSKMNSAIKAISFTNKSQISQNKNEETEEEESAEQKEEVVVVKEVNENQFDMSHNKAYKCQQTQEEFRKSLDQNNEDHFDVAQQTMNYFLIEFDHNIFKEINAKMLNNYHIIKNIPKESLQMIVNKLDEKGISHNFEMVFSKAEKKFNTKEVITAFRSDVSKFPKYVQTAVIPVKEDEKTNKKMEKFKFDIPDKDSLWHHDVPQILVDEILKSFFQNFQSNEVSVEFLKIVVQTFHGLEQHLPNCFTSFNKYDIRWEDEENWKKFKNALKEDDPEMLAIMEKILSKKKELYETFDNLKKIMENSDEVEMEAQELIQRFGSVPDFLNESNLENARYLIRFYWQMKYLIEFNRKLMIMNLLFDGEIKNISKQELNKFVYLNSEKLLEKMSDKKLIIDASRCQDYMQLKGFQSISFRFLVSQIKNYGIEIYENERYGNIEMIESYKGEPLKQIYFDGKNFFNVVPDWNLRQLIAARSTLEWDEHFNKNEKRLDQLSWNYQSDSSKIDFAKYFLPSFSKTVVEWIECYLLATKNNDRFLKLLHEKFEVDGNHLGIADFQFLISTSILLQSSYEVDPNFILKFASSLCQSNMVDNFFILRLESQWRTQLETTSELLDTLKTIPHNKLKILLATKLDAKLDKNAEKNETMLHKLLLMLRHTSANNDQLEKMSLQEWISAAKKQKYFNVCEAVKDHKYLGYYIIYLKQQEKHEAANTLEKLLSNPEKLYHIPEKLLAQICSFIIFNEITFDNSYVTNLENLLRQITKESSHPKNGKHILITNEVEQLKMIEKVENDEAYKALFVKKERDLQVVGKLIKGVHHDDETSKHMISLIKNPENNLTLLLNEFNECMRKTPKNSPRGYGLRDTQKMAIIYAVESDKNLLSQVKPGEGKSFIVAGIATIQAKRTDTNAYKAVDIITSSSVLAQRDAEDMKELYEAMNLTVDHICHEDMEMRKQAYKADIIYGDIGRFQRDYLLQNFYRKNVMGDRKREDNCIIVDEVDNMLLDNGNNMLYLSHTVPGMDLLDSFFVYLQKLVCFPTIKGDKEKAFATVTIEAKILADLLGRLSKEDIELLANDDKSKSNCFNVWTDLIENQIIDPEGYLFASKPEDFDTLKLHEVTTPKHAIKILSCLKAIVNRQREIIIPTYLIPFVRRHLVEYIENAKRSLFIKPNDAYVVDVDHTGQDSDVTQKITIIDKNTGVDLATSQWSEGLHQSVQVKHGCKIYPVSMKAVFISNVNYLKGYARINGLSGTLGSHEESKTLAGLYQADLITIPTFEPKRLYEKVPVIAKDQCHWLNSIFDEVNNQVEADRSVLVICKSIDEVKEIKKGLEKRFMKMKNITELFLENTSKLGKCYNNITPYIREFDNFNFKGKSALKPGQLLISTNLAGRGTDIELSDTLRDAGGLHVIVSFLPENSRIEDQAYGRAGRCGNPGSGQIITLDNSDTKTATSVFDLKNFRDNEEVKRLKSMTDYYNYHTKIEEECLSAFKEHCLAALGLMTNCKQGKKGVPTTQEIIYFALLDEWALWLDSQSAAIKQCAKDRSALQKSNIIASVKSFLEKHPISDKEITWINSPQPLLALGLVNIEAGLVCTAGSIFDQIIEKFPEFYGESYYYKGILSQPYVRKIKEDIIPKIGDNEIGWFKRQLNKVGQTFNKTFQDNMDKDILPDALCEIDDIQRIKTEDFLHLSIGSFNQKIEMRKELHTIVSRIQETPGSQIIKSSGFKNQCDDIETVYDCLSTSAFDMIGHPISFTTFNSDAKTIEEKYAAFEKFLKYESEGYVSPKTLNNRISDYQCELFRRKYMFSKTMLQKLFKEMLNDEDRIEPYGRIVVQEDMIKKACKLPRREEFWAFLDIYGCLKAKEEFYILQTCQPDGKIDELRNLKLMEAPKQKHFRIQLSDFDLSSKKLYKSTDIQKAFLYNPEKLKWLESMEYLIKDASAIVRKEKFENAGFLTNFDYFVIEDLADWLEITVNEASWIAQKLLSEGTVRVQKQQLTKVNNTNVNFLPENIKNKYLKFMETTQLKKIDDISVDVVKSIFKETPEESLITHNEMIKHKIIIPYVKHIFFQNINSLECPFLPECIRSSIEMFLFHKFAYTFAYNNLLKSLEASEQDQSVQCPIMLAWKPHKSLYSDLIKFGFIHDHKLELRGKEFLGKKEQEKIKKVEEMVKPRLFIKSGTLMSTKEYFQNENVDASMDVQNRAINSMKQVGKIGENYWWILWLVLKIAYAVFMAWSIQGIVLLAFDIAFNFKSYFATALLVIAAVGTMLYFVQIVKAKYVTQTAAETGQEQYSRLLNFHSKTLEKNEIHKEETKLIDKLTSSLLADIKNLFNIDYTILNKALLEEFKVKKVSQKKFVQLALKALNQPHNWRLFYDEIREILVRVKVKLAGKYFAGLNDCKVNGKIDSKKAMEKCEKLSNESPISIDETDKKLLESLAQKIVEDCVTVLQETEEHEKSKESEGESGEYSEEEEIPEKFRELGSGINIDTDEDEENLESETIFKKSKKETTKSLCGIESFDKSFQTQICNAFKKETQIQVEKPLIDLFKRYIENSDEDYKPPQNFSEYLEKDITEKYGIELKKKQVDTFQSMSFIVLDFQNVLKDIYEKNPNKALLCALIGYGHPISKTALKTIVHALLQMFKIYINDLGDIQLVVNGAIFACSSKKTAKSVTISLTLNHDHFYICQNDSRKLLTNKKNGGFIEACLFEAIQKNESLHEISKKGADVFRNLLLEELNRLKI